MTSIHSTKSNFQDWVLPFLYFFGRIMLFLGLIPNELHGFGDLPQYFKVASLKGWPYINYWVEYPPVFSFLNAAVYRLAGGQQFVYDFMMIMLFSLSGAAGIWLFQRIATKLYGERSGWIRAVIYLALLAPLTYTWWYYDLIPVCLVLLAIYMLLSDKGLGTGLSIGAGILTKWFPALLLPAVWRYRSHKSALLIGVLSLGITTVVFGGLYLASPKMTAASLKSQPGRASWESIWALIDQNYTTGEYILVEERTDPSLAGIPRGNPAVVPSWMTLLVFAGLGLWFYRKVQVIDTVSLLSFMGITWTIFLIWSPGWSPQWILYLIPLILLSLPYEKGLFWIMLLVLVTLFEWPTLLKHNLFDGLWIVVPARILIFGVLIFLWYRQIRRNWLPSEE